MFRTIIVVFSLICACMGIFVAHTLADNDTRIRVVTTVVPIASIVEIIGGKFVQVSNITKTGMCAHDYSLKPSQMNRLKTASIVILIDRSFEQNIFENLLKTNIKGKLLEIGQITGIKHHYNDGAINWHVWLNLTNATLIAVNILDTLIDIAPKHKEAFLKNYENFINKVNAIQKRINNIEMNNEIVVLSSDLMYVFDNVQYRKSLIKDFSMRYTTKPSDIDKLKEYMKSTRAKCVYFSEHSCPSQIKDLSAENNKISFIDIEPEGWKYYLNYGSLFDEFFENWILSFEKCQKPAVGIDLMRN